MKKKARYLTWWIKKEANQMMRWMIAILTLTVQVKMKYHEGVQY